MTRKQLVISNLGQIMNDAAVQDYPGVAAAHTNTVLVDRMLISLLKEEFERINAEPTRAQAYFSHFFHGAIGEEETAKILTYLCDHPVTVTAGFTRRALEIPCIAVVIEQETQAERFLGDDVGETIEAEGDVDTADFRGSFFDCTYALYIYAEHPDVCSYIYQITKMILVGTQIDLENNGFFNSSIMGSEIVANPELLPENMFVRTVRVSGKALTSVPVWVRDPSKFQARVFRDDVVVDGVRGGVSSTDPEGGGD